MRGHGGEPKRPRRGGEEDDPTADSKRCSIRALTTRIACWHPKPMRGSLLCHDDDDDDDEKKLPWELCRMESEEEEEGKKSLCLT